MIRKLLTAILSLSSLQLIAQDREDAAVFATESALNFLPDIGVISGLGSKITADRFVKAPLMRLSSADPKEDAIPYGDVRIQESDDVRFGIRLQDSLFATSTGASPATFNYRAINGVEDWTARGALLLDVYLPKSLPFLGYKTGCTDCDGNSLRFTFAGEYNRFEVDGSETDHFSLGFFATWNTRFFRRVNLAGSTDYLTQPVKIGGLFTRNNLTGSEQWTLLLQADPVFRLFRKFIIGARNRFTDSRPGDFPFSWRLPKSDPYPSEKGSESIGGSGQGRSIFEADRDVTNPELINIAGIDIRPILGLRLADGTSVSGIEDLDNTFFNYGVRAVLPLFRNRLTFGYQVDTMQELRGNSSFVHQTAFVDASPRPFDSKSPLVIRLAWQSGEAAPTFDSLEGWSVGLGVKF